MQGKRRKPYQEAHTINCTAELCAEIVGGVLRSRYGEQRNVPKRLSARLRSTPRAVQNWYYSVTAPRMHELVKLMAECSELEAEVLRLVAQVREKAK